MPFTALQSTFDGLYPAGLQWYWRADFFNEISDAAIEVHRKYGRTAAHRPLHHAHVSHRRRRQPRARRRAPPFAYRDGGWAGVIVGVDPDPANAALISQWAKDYWQELHPTSAGGAYINFMMNEGQDRVNALLPRQLRPARPDQADVRPGQHLPHQPEHPARQRAALSPTSRPAGRRPTHRGRWPARLGTADAAITGPPRLRGSLMSRPVLFVIDDDPGVVRALHDDLSRRFGEDFRVVGASSAAAGLATLRDLADGHEAVALLIAGHRMREMPGVDFLRSAHAMHPLAKRVLLVERDYSARSPVVRAMTLGQADYHLSKPWMLEQDLYREISEFLADWAKDQEAGFELFHIIGRLQDPSTHELRELLTRFNVPFHFHAADTAQGRRLLAGQGLDASRLPVMIRHDGYTMVEPGPAQIIESVGGSTRNDVDECDLVVVGAGPAG